MHHTGRNLALAACLVFTGSIASASPVRSRDHATANKKAKHKTPDKTAATARSTKKHKAAPRERDDEDKDDDRIIDMDGHRVAFVSHDADEDVIDLREAVDDERPERVDPPVRLHKPAVLSHRDWHLSFGPNVWASSVDATVNLGNKSVSTGSDFFQLEHHVRYGVPLLVEAGYGRFSLVTDMTYGVIDLDGGKDVGPVMVTLNATASSLMVDSMAGFRLYGDDRSLLSFEARVGGRYQRTAVNASVGFGGPAGTPYDLVQDGLDILAGGRVFVRPSNRIFASGTADFGLFGTSTKTWSAGVDANVRITSHVLLSLGWRTLTMDRAYLDMVMHGPRAAVQAVF